MVDLVVVDPGLLPWTRYTLEVRLAARTTVSGPSATPGGPSTAPDGPTSATSTPGGPSSVPGGPSATAWSQAVQGQARTQPAPPFRYCILYRE